MEASVESAVASTNGTDPEASGVEAAEHSPAEARDSSRLFEFAEFVHVGPGADTCLDADNGKCSNTLHFHAWCRLPNPFQRSSIAEKAAAAKARRKRQLHDPDSDARVLLDDAIQTLVRDDNREPLIEEVADQDFLRDHLQAMQTIAEEEEYEHIDEDKERLRAIDAMDPENRPTEEHEELTAHVEKFTELVTAERDRIQQPLRDSLKERSTEELAELVRGHRIENVAQAAFNDSYSRWEWYIGTLKPRDPAKGLPSERVFSSIDHLTACAPEVYDALDGTFTRLEAAQGGQLKNS